MQIRFLETLTLSLPWKFDVLQGWTLKNPSKISIFTNGNISRIFKEFWFFSRYYQALSRIFNDFWRFSRIFQGFSRIFKDFWGISTAQPLTWSHHSLINLALKFKDFKDYPWNILELLNSSTLDLNLKKLKNSSLDLKQTWISRSRSRILVGQGLVWPP